MEKQADGFLSSQQQQVNDAWKLMGGADKGFITIMDFFKIFDETMPKMFDRSIALELFKELNSDKGQGRMCFKDFNDAIKF